MPHALRNAPNWHDWNLEDMRAQHFCGVTLRLPSLPPILGYPPPGWNHRQDRSCTASFRACSKRPSAAALLPTSPLVCLFHEHCFQCPNCLVVGWKNRFTTYKSTRIDALTHWHTWENHDGPFQSKILRANCCLSVWPWHSPTAFGPQELCRGEVYRGNSTLT